MVYLRFIVTLLLFISLSITGSAQLCAPYASQTALYVDSAATSGTMDGTSWNNAFTSLSEALDIARQCEIDSILVGEGTYFPEDSLGMIPAIPQYVSFTLPDTIVLLGGFSPINNVITVADRDWEQYPTILSGDLTGNDSTSYPSIFELDDTPDRADNAFHIINQKSNPTDSSTLIDGFYFIGGNANADGLGANPELGGAIFLEASHPTINNCDFKYNSADASGGAIHIDEESTLRGANLTFSRNYADNTGGAIASSGRLALDNCTFNQNIGFLGGSVASTFDILEEGPGGPGPAVPQARSINYKSADTANEDEFPFKITLSNCHFTSDTAFAGGSIFTLFSEVVIDSSSFTNNNAEVEGGAMVATFSHYCGANNQFISNDCSGIGGAIYFNNNPIGGFFFSAGADLRSKDTKFKYKKARLKAFMPNFFDDIPINVNAIVENGKFTNNRSVDAGGAIAWFGDSISIIQTRFDSNSVDSLGGAIGLTGNYTLVDSCFFDGNKADIGGSIATEVITEFDCFDCPPIIEDFDLRNILEVSNSTFQRDSASFGGSISSFEYDTRVSGNTFQYNYADEYGGAIESYDSKYTGSNNLFAFNEAGIGGGAIATEVCLGCSVEGPPIGAFQSSSKDRRGRRNRIKNNEKNNNKSAALPPDQIGTSTFTNSTFALNNALMEGSVFSLKDTRDTISNCIIYENFGASNDIFYEEIASTNDTVYITHTLLEDSGGSGANWDNSMGIDGGGNIDERPLFIDDDIPDPILGIVGNFRLEPCSPAIDAGTFTPMLNPGSVDLDGNMRVQGAIVDMGAYEFAGFPITTRIYVDSAAVTGNNDGSSWDNAFLELYDAMNARCLDPGDTILVAKGTYLPDTTELMDHRTASFPLEDLMVIIGGFNPAIGLDSIGEQLPFVQKSIMSGDIGVPNDSLDNSYHVINNNGVTLTKGTLIDGMHISYGTANGISFPDNRGGGMFNDRDTFDLANCTFEFNSAIGVGGAIYNTGVTIDITNCRFNDNFSPSDFGGAGALQNRNSNIKISKTLFVRNTGRFGGAVHNNSGSLKLSDSYFDQNESAFGGAAIYASGANDTIVQSVFTRGISSSQGSAILGVNTIMAINNNTFFDNLNTSTSLGSTAAAVNLTGSSSGSITNNIIYGNKIGAPNSGTSLRRSLSLSINDHALVTVSNNIVENLFQLSSSYPASLGTDGGGNIDAYPEFIDTLTYDLGLACNSPAIDKGTDSLRTLCLTAFDFIDSARVVGKRIDIGAYELQEDCQTIEVSDIAFGEVCDTTTMRVFIKNQNIGDLVIDTIISTNNTFSYIQSTTSFPYTIDYCDSLAVDVRYNPTTSGASSGSLVVTSNAINGTSTTINLSGTLDITLPTLSCSDSTVYLDASGMATIDTSFFINSVSDNCGIDTVYISRTEVSCSDIGSPVVITITARDIHGNVQTCSPSLTVLDTISPLLTTQAATIYLDNDGNASLDTSMTIATLSDNCNIDTVFLSQTAFDCDDTSAPINVTTTAKDGSENTSTSVALITVRDTTSPIMKCKNINVYLSEVGSVDIVASDIDNGSTDNCGSPMLSINMTQFGCSEVGMNQVTLTGTDNSMNSSSCIATVTVIDTFPPIAMCQDTIIYLDADGSASITADMINNSSTDACGIDTLIASKLEFSCADVGDNIVVLTVTDNNGNSATCNATVTVRDTIAPQAICKSDTFYLDMNGMVTITTMNVDNGSSDSCGIAMMTLSQTSFSCADLGANTATLTVTDNNDNVSTCEATITILDTIAPMVTCKNIDLYVDADGMVSITPADIVQDTSDNCSGITLTTNLSTLQCPVGEKNVTLTATDGSGNSDSCIAVVTLIDTFPPLPICKDTFVYLDAMGMATIEIDLVLDTVIEPCGILSGNFFPKVFTCDSVGLNNVLVGVIDDSDNIGICTSQVTVIDTISPIAICKNLNLILELDGSATITGADIDNGSNDACGIASMTVSKSTFDCADVGDNEVTMTVTDNNGNTSTCTSTVTVSIPTSPITTTITGPAVVCDTLNNLPYSVPAIEGLTYNWSYSGTGATIKNNGSAEVLLDLLDVSPGTLSVDLITGCGSNVGSASYDVNLGSVEFCGLAECLRDFTFVSTEVLDIANSIDVYKASGTIKSEAVIDAPRAIIFKAGESIDIHSPFEVAAGAVLVGQIEACID